MIRTILVLSRPGCCLCDEALAVLREMSRTCSSVPFQVDVRDVDSDPVLAREYGESIPVGFVDGALAFKGHVDVRRLIRRLEGGGIFLRLSRRLRFGFGRKSSSMSPQDSGLQPPDRAGGRRPDRS